MGRRKADIFSRSLHPEANAGFFRRRFIKGDVPMPLDSTDTTNPAPAEQLFWISPAGRTAQCLQPEPPGTSGTPGVVNLRERTVVEGQVDEAQLWSFDGTRLLWKKRVGDARVALSHDGAAVGAAMVAQEADQRQQWSVIPGGLLASRDGQSVLTAASPPGGTPAVSMAPKKEPIDRDQLWSLQQYQARVDTSTNQLPLHEDGKPFTISSKAYTNLVIATMEADELRIRPDTYKPVDSILWVYKKGGIFNVRNGLALTVNGNSVWASAWRPDDRQFWLLNNQGHLIDRHFEHLMQVRPGTLEADKRPDSYLYNPLLPLMQCWRLRRFPI